MFQHRMWLGKPARWVAGVLEKSGDLAVLGGGMIGLALIVAMVLVGLHERHSSFRSVSPPEYAQGASYH
jgi:hypothetical protein